MKLEVKLAIVQTVLLGLACLLLAVILVRGSSGQTREIILAQHLANLRSIYDSVAKDMIDLYDDKEAVEGLKVSSKRLSEMIIKTRIELLK